MKGVFIFSLNDRNMRWNVNVRGAVFCLQPHVETRENLLEKLHSFMMKDKSRPLWSASFFISNHANIFNEQNQKNSQNVGVWSFTESPCCSAASAAVFSGVPEGTELMKRSLIGSSSDWNGQFTCLWQLTSRFVYFQFLQENDSRKQRKTQLNVQNINLITKELFRRSKKMSKTENLHSYFSFKDVWKLMWHFHH